MSQVTGSGVLALAGIAVAGYLLYRSRNVTAADVDAWSRSNNPLDSLGRAVGGFVFDVQDMSANDLSRKYNPLDSVGRAVGSGIFSAVDAVSESSAWDIVANNGPLASFVRGNVDNFLQDSPSRAELDAQALRGYYWDTSGNRWVAYNPGGPIF